LDTAAETAVGDSVWRWQQCRQWRWQWSQQPVGG
jgi:hypothetical protein